MRRALQIFDEQELAEQRDEGFRKRKADLRWCKDRALEYVDLGEPATAFMSFVSDTQKTWTADTPPIDWSQLIYTLLLGTGQKAAAEHDTVQMRNWIEGFN